MSVESSNIKNAFTHLPLPDLTPRSAHLGFHLLQDILVNHIHLIFKIAIYNQRNAGFCSLNYIKSKIKAIKEIEQNITYLNPNAKLLNAQKWARKWARMAVLPPENCNIRTTYLLKAPVRHQPPSPPHYTLPVNHLC